MIDIDPLLGPDVREIGWVPAPRYVLRRSRILTLLEVMPPGSELVEVGCGAGMLLQELTLKGMACQAVETSTEARKLAEEVNRRFSGVVKLHSAPRKEWRECFDGVLALEVLEHIYDDATALAEWHGFLRAGGRLFLSVPAHMSKWHAGDEWAGHYRRYERQELLERIQQAGFEVEHFESYGFPLANALDLVSAWRYGRAVASNESERERGSQRSGTDRGVEARLYPFVRNYPGRLILAAAVAIQKLFKARDFGNGYIVVARKR